MSEQASTETTDETTETEETTEEQRVPYERFQSANKKAKEAAERAKALEKQVAELSARVEEREAKNLPELDQLKQRLEKAEKRAADAEAKADQADQQVARSKTERLVLAAAAQAGFDDPSDALRFSDIVDLDAIEDNDQAERAVKRLAKAKPRLLKDEEPKLPGRVLENGKPAKPEERKGGIDADAEAITIRDGLRQFTKQWHTAGE